MGIGANWYKQTLLKLAGHRGVERLAQRYGGKMAARFVAGETLQEALQAVDSLEEQGIMATVDHLGESVRTLEEAAGYRDEYMRLVRRLEGRGASANVSLKPTQVGLALDPEACCANIRAVAEAAQKSQAFVRIDMEGSAYTQATLDLVRRLRAEGLTNVGAVLQAALRRSELDAQALIRDGVPLRLVKGAYREPAGVALQQPKSIAEALRRLVRQHLDRGAYAAIASHDDAIIGWTRSYAEQRGIGKDAFEFQMLYGLRMNEQRRLAREGYRVRCYVPYGAVWYPYFTRRLAEKPAHLWMVLKNARR